MCGVHMYIYLKKNKKNYPSPSSPTHSFSSNFSIPSTSYRPASHSHANIIYFFTIYIFIVYYFIVYYFIIYYFIIYYFIIYYFIIYYFTINFFMVCLLLNTENEINNYRNYLCKIKILILPNCHNILNSK